MFKPFALDSKFGLKIISIINNYNHDKYWRRREILVDPTSKASVFKKLWYLYYIKKLIRTTAALSEQILILVRSF